MTRTGHAEAPQTEGGIVWKWSPLSPSFALGVSGLRASPKQGQWWNTALWHLAPKQPLQTPSIHQSARVTASDVLSQFDRLSWGRVYYCTSHLWPGCWSHVACGLLPKGYGGTHLDSSPLQNLFFSQSSHPIVEAISDPILPNLVSLLSPFSFSFSAAVAPSTTPSFSHALVSWCQWHCPCLVFLPTSVAVSSWSLLLGFPPLITH